MHGLIALIVFIGMIAGQWRVLEKVGHPGWGALIPIYNIYIMIKIAGHPGWWLFLLLVPLVNIAISMMIYVDIASQFGKGLLFGLGLLFLPFIFYPILGFGNARYRG